MHGVTVGLVLLVDVALAGAGSWMIYDHLRKPAVVAAGEVGAPPAAAAPSPAPSSIPAPQPTPAAKREVVPPPVATTAAQPERPQPERSLPAPAKPSSSGRLPDKPAPLPVQTCPDAAVPLPPAPPPDAALSPPPPHDEPPDAAPAAVDPSGADPSWVESMTRGIRNVVEDHRADIEDCYVRTAKEATRESPIQGRVEVHLTIVPSGDAEDVRVVENQTGSEELGTCLVAIMRTWRYPAPGQESMEFVWPFNFQARPGRP